MIGDDNKTEKKLEINSNTNEQCMIVCVCVCDQNLKFSILNFNYHIDSIYSRTYNIYIKRRRKNLLVWIFKKKNNFSDKEKSL